MALMMVQNELGARMMMDIPPTSEHFRTQLAAGKLTIVGSEDDAVGTRGLPESPRPAAPGEDAAAVAAAVASELGTGDDFVSLDEPGVVRVPDTLPRGNASLATWIEYAIARGISPDDVAGKTRDYIRNLFLFTPDHPDDAKEG